MMIDPNELLPCPFCGGKAEICHFGNEYTKSRKVVIKCTKCRITRIDAALKHGFDWLDKVAIAAWNQRTETTEVIRFKEATHETK